MNKNNNKEFSQSRLEPQIVAEHRLGMTFFLFFIIMIGTSFIPEKTVLTWIIINSIFTLIFLGILFFLWTKYKYDTVKYYSFQVYIMLMGIVFFGITPIFKLSYPSIYFWIIAFITTTLIISSHLLRKRIVMSFVNKKHKILLTILSIYMMLLIIIGIALMAIMRNNQSPENAGMSILIY
ncbi:MAG: hypothetical protein ACE3JQ_01050 [Paenisporosarcina sp.]